jgi:hypothetical protein
MTTQIRYQVAHTFKSGMTCHIRSEEVKEFGTLLHLTWSNEADAFLDKSDAERLATVLTELHGVKFIVTEIEL